jgi:hypothetical protein
MLLKDQGKTMNITFGVFFTILMAVHSTSIHAQELGELNLPKSGLTVTDLANEVERWERYYELTRCSRDTGMIGDVEISWSGDCIRFTSPSSEYPSTVNGGFTSTMFDGTEQAFDQVQLESDDLPICEYYLKLRGYGNIAALTLVAPSSRYMTDLLAVQVAGMTATPNENRNGIILSNVDVTWVSNGSDPLSQRILRNKLISDENSAITVPFHGSDINVTTEKLNELGVVCEAFF